MLCTGCCEIPAVLKPISLFHGILKKWRQQGVKTVDDIAKRAGIYKAKKKRNTSQKSSQYNAKPNAFNSFQQKDMSAELDEMEQLFLDEINSH